MFQNGDKVLVKSLFEKGDKIECTVVGVAASDMITREPYMYIVKPEIRREEWECYTTMKSNIELH